MTWLFFALLCACGEAVKDVLSKRGLSVLTALGVTWSFFAATVLFCAPLLIFLDVPELKPLYWVCLFAHSTLYGLTIWLFMRAVQASDISLSIPMTMFSPVFLLLTGRWMLGEQPSIAGVLGVFLIVIGSYLLNVRSARKGVLAPFRALLSEPGSRLMLFVAFLWSITAPLDKLGIASSSPFFWGVTIFSLTAVLLTLFMFVYRRAELKAAALHWRTTLPIGAANSVQLAGYVFALSGGFAAYVIAIKRTSVLMVLILSWWLLGEKLRVERLLGALTMVAGVFLIASGSA